MPRLRVSSEDQKRQASSAGPAIIILRPVGAVDNRRIPGERAATQPFLMRPPLDAPPATLPSAPPQAAVSARRLPPASRNPHRVARHAPPRPRPFGRAISGRRFSRNNARRPRRQWLGAESLEPRAILSTVPFLADSALQTATLFTAQGRYGNNAINGDWELGITTNTNKPPQQQTGHIWNGSLDSATGVTTVREQFTFDVLNTTAASFSIGGSKKISFDYAGQLTGNQPNAIKIWAKASTANSGLTLANLKLKTPGMSVPKEFPEASIAVSQSSGPDFQQRLIAGVDFSSGSGQSVTLTGDLGMSFAQTSPRGSSLQFHVMAV